MQLQILNFAVLPYEFLPHRIPPLLDYPLLTPVPERLLGIDYTLCYVISLWLENQLFDALPAPPEHWQTRIPDYYGLPLNQCEQPLINALGRRLVGKLPDTLELMPEDLEELTRLFQQLSEDSRKVLISDAVTSLCGDLGIRDPGAAAYAAVLPELLMPRLNAALPTRNLGNIFL